jgi:large subunit ribosomal protein L4|tara:strand:+ start:858 stop:1481 length:624 start_codon:yes stop_codon:yes gene_type:complete
MKLDKITIDGKKDTIEVLDKVFGSKINKQLVSNVLYKTNANYKGRKAKTKQKNEIIGSTSKIYAQKGTGNARHASRKAPIFVGGGVAHGPKGEKSYKIRKLNKTEKKQSITSILSEKNKKNDVVIYSNFEKPIKKTKEMYSMLLKNNLINSILIFDKNSITNVEKATRNIPHIKITDVNHFSAYDLIKYKKIVFTETSVKELQERYK